MMLLTKEPASLLTQTLEKLAEHVAGLCLSLKKDTSRDCLIICALREYLQQNIPKALTNVFVALACKVFAEQRCTTYSEAILLANTTVLRIQVIDPFIPPECYDKYYKFYNDIHKNLCKLSELQYLSWNIHVKEPIDRFPEILVNLQYLRKLELETCLTDEVMKVLRHCENLTEVNGNRSTLVSQSGLLELCYCKKLRIISLIGCPSLKPLIIEQFLYSLTSLTYLLCDDHAGYLRQCKSLDCIKYKLKNLCLVQPDPLSIKCSSIVFPDIEYLKVTNLFDYFGNLNVCFKMLKYLIICEANTVFHSLFSWTDFQLKKLFMIDCQSLLLRDVLSLCPKLKSLNLQRSVINVSYSDTKLPLQYLETLILKDVTFMYYDDSFDEVIKVIFKVTPRVEKLVLGDLKINMKVIKVDDCLIGKLIPYLINLKEIIILKSEITMKGLRNLVQSCYKLQHLEVHGYLEKNNSDSINNISHKSLKVLVVEPSNDL